MGQLANTIQPWHSWCMKCKVKWKCSTLLDVIDACNTTHKAGYTSPWIVKRLSAAGWTTHRNKSIRQESVNSELERPRLVTLNQPIEDWKDEVTFSSLRGFHLVTILATQRKRQKEPPPPPPPGVRFGGGVDSIVNFMTSLSLEKPQLNTAVLHTKLVCCNIAGLMPQANWRLLHWWHVAESYLEFTST